MKNSIIDLSWIIHKYRHSLKDLCTYRNNVLVPTGHVYGTYKFVGKIASISDRVILAVDSKSYRRKGIYSAYKSNRHIPSGNPYDDYDCFQDLGNILALCTSFNNVYYVKEDDCEADDIIATFIKKSRTVPSEWYMYFRDNDILQTKGDYILMVDFKSGNTEYPCKRNTYLKEKFEIDKDYLPLIYKVIRGDTSDCIKPSIPRYPKDLLLKCCNEIGYEPNLEEIIKVLLSQSYNKLWKERIELLKDTNSEIYKNVKTNYEIVKPITDVPLKLRKSDVKDIDPILNYYQIKELNFELG